MAMQTGDAMKIRSHRELDVYKMAFDASMKIFEISKSFPHEERFSLTDQIRRSSRSVTGNAAEAFRKRRYPKSFVAKVSDSEAEAAETQVWLEYAHACGYLGKETYEMLFNEYERILGKLVNMSLQPEKWCY